MSELKEVQAKKAQREIGSAERSLTNARDLMATLPQEQGGLAVGAISSALKSVQRAGKRVSMAIALIVGASVALNTGDALAASDAEHMVGGAEWIDDDSTRWSIGKNEDPMEGLTGVVMHSPVSNGENGGTTVRFRVACEAGNSTPSVDLHVSGANRPFQTSDGHEDMRMRFDYGQAMWQGGEVIDNGDETVFRVFQRPVVPRVREQHLPHADRRFGQAADRSSEPHGQRSRRVRHVRCGIGRCHRPARRALRHAEQAATGGIRARHPASLPHGASRSPTFVAANSMAVEPSMECNRGLFSREGARWTGRLVGALAGHQAGKRLDNGKSRGRLVGALVGAIVGDRIASTTDRRMQDRRAAASPGVGEARLYQLHNGDQVGFATLANGDVCVTMSDSAGREKRTRRFDAERAYEWERSFVNANARRIGLPRSHTR